MASRRLGLRLLGLGLLLTLLALTGECAFVPLYSDFAHSLVFNLGRRPGFKVRVVTSELQTCGVSVGEC